jgi:hypothetical protein
MRKIEKRAKAGKVFCADCKYENGMDCNHHENLKDDWYAKRHAHKSEPYDINEKNNCPWFQRYHKV